MEIYTVGYGGLYGMDALQAALHEVVNPVLIDVRAQPTCGWCQDYCQERLASAMGPERYHWFKPLGNPRRLLPWRPTSTPEHRQAIYRVLALEMRAGRSIVFLCSEQNPEICHRTEVAEEFKSYILALPSIQKRGEMVDIVHLRTAGQLNLGL